LCLLSAVIIGLGATGAADPVAAERAPASEAERGYGKPGTARLPVNVSTAAEQGYGKLGTAHLPVYVTAEAEQGSGKLGTADLPIDVSAQEELDRRLAASGMTIGSPIMIRIFKSEAELEVWMKAGERFELLATYPICNWAGTLGPKLSEGDMQSPEGLYFIGRHQLHQSARWRRSLDIGYPNAFDRVHARTGSSILVHGGCTSTGCFAMTDQVMEQIFRLSRAALWKGQKRIPMHIFPFRMTPENMAAHADSDWQGFWANLKEAYDLFERTRLPPAVKVCNRRYVVSGADDNDDGCPVRVAMTPGKLPRIAPAPRTADVTVVSHRRGRNARKAYAEARKARLVSKAKQQVKPGSLRHAESAGYRKLPR
jgi:murein L,D-transpeptidase YafK